MKEQRNISTIAPFLADDFIDIDEPIFDLIEYGKVLDQYRDRLGLFKKYLICKLHDSWVIDFSTQVDCLKIKLNDFSTFVFADCIIEKFQLPIDSDNISFPLTIELKGDLKVEFNKVDENGELQNIEPLNLSEYLYEQITKIENDKIEIVFNFWRSNLNSDLPGENIILIVSARELILNEEQDQAWTNLFDNAYSDYYQYFKQQFDSDRYVSDHNECEKLIEEFKNMNK